MSRTGTGANSRETMRDGGRPPGLMLSMGTLGFAVNFWAWALLSPLGPLFREQGTLGSLSESDVALLVAVPVIAGSLGRIVVGALTDRFGGRAMFPLVSAVTIVPTILFIAFAGLSSYALLTGTSTRTSTATTTSAPTRCWRISGRHQVRASSPASALRT